MSPDTNTKKRAFRTILIMAGVVLVLAVVAAILFNTTLQAYNEQAEKAAIFDGDSSKISATYGYGRRFATETEVLSFIVPEDLSAPLVMWSKGITGEFHFAIEDEDGITVYKQQGQDTEVSEKIPLKRGSYSVKLAFMRFSGSLKFRISDVRFVITLPDRYQYVQANSDAGFHWDYILYQPEVVASPYLLVVPNNSGSPGDYPIIREAAKNEAQTMSSLADSLGVPMLIPVFPRPTGDLDEFYTHNLDRDALLMDVEGYQRLDLQLLAMVEDARSTLAAEQIVTNERFLMWGFSASGTFTDRFSLLHPDRLKAVAAGMCWHSLPFPQYAGENLPYPIGTYDYEAITGHPFDLQEFASLPRFLFKGSEDTGGTITSNDDVYPANQYFDLFVRPEIEAENPTLPIPLVDSFEMSHREEDIIRYRIYDGAIVVGEFKAVSKIFAEAGLNNSHFKLYEGARHEYSADMRADVTAFFKDVIE
jgi:hypothetical protein